MLTEPDFVEKKIIIVMPQRGDKISFKNDNIIITDINGKIKYELGISDGSMNMIISDSGVGKTTIATQIATNIIKPFKTSCIFYEQAEATGTNIQRLKNLTGMDDQEFENRFIVRDSGITTESIYARTKMIYDIKVNNQCHNICYKNFVWEI